ncbi:tRNA1(Val) (adenine(37)-N6)-methyltransferase [Adhaeribacter aerolatus]|uniref:tRNA1(Val) (adenine(37)-N6)-methyltransferase n=1 Tax=Adhaeribacter aerolatus TaxID=670289 RepID=A0A512ATL0_9BACT|nr:methyltransferase [Adhaeribacter aerolatus]GEO03049.1 tRNA1(Val) (adenine(37)-N6)-methyltransferase [Adhaeribacter aerolatus]
MPNDYFRFKQFLVKQDKCAMKVCTDSCILGAYAPVAEAKTILDIGTGTGLLALMTAQRSEAQIQAIEIDALAAVQARENIAASPWADRISVYHQSLQEFAQHNQTLFDVIICNPPFYAASHKSPDKARNLAMHSHEFSLAELVHFSERFLSPNGCLFVLLPPAESRHLFALAENENLHLHSALQIFTATNGKHIRTVQEFSRNPATSVLSQDLFIRNPDNSYTPAFQQLLREYYLIF